MPGNESKPECRFVGAGVFEAPMQLNLDKLN